MAGESTVGPALFTGRGQELIPVTHVLMDAVAKCDALLRDHGMQMVILCEHCVQAGRPDPKVYGNNERGGTTFELTCVHARRIHRIV